MIAKAKWFNRRKYTGWGLEPKTWQGFLYVGVLVTVLVLIQSLPLEAGWKIGLSVGGVVFILVDVLQALASIKLDEREQKMETMAERNASWTMVTALAFSIIYLTTLGNNMVGSELIPLVVLPIILGMIAKGVTYYVLEKRGV